MIGCCNILSGHNSNQTLTLFVASQNPDAEIHGGAGNTWLLSVSVSPFRFSRVNIGY